MTVQTKQSSAEVPPLRPAATLIVVRDAPVGLEVLLLRRAERGDHTGGAWVFPGGVVEAGDARAHACAAGLDDAHASARLGMPSGGLDFYIAAVRECFEECGLLFAERPGGELLHVGHEAWHQLVDWREALHKGERSLSELCEAGGVQLSLGRLVYLSHWVTPVMRAKRFDTRFFIAEAPAGQVAAHDDNELVEQRWMKPADALAASARLKLMTPTQKTLEALARFDSVHALLDWARAPREVSAIMPRIGTGSQGTRPVTPDEPSYAELGRLDPHGHGRGSYELTPEVPVRLSERLVRVTANNGSVMTGPGTNTYLVGGGPRNEWAVIDPGPDDDAHVEAILAAAPGPVRWIFATHTHRDHSPATAALKERTGAVVHGMLPTHPEWQDTAFAPEVALSGGERFDIAEGVTLRAIHTPGHASNHVCYVLEQEKMLFAGDHVMQQSTVVINPPDGDMRAYVESLRSLLAEDLEWIAPGHGFLMAEPKRAIEWIVAHRLKREAKVADALRALGPADADALLVQVYDDVPQRLHGVAMRSLKAHLLKLQAEGRASESEGLWQGA